MARLVGSGPFPTRTHTHAGGEHCGGAPVSRCRVVWAPPPPSGVSCVFVQPTTLITFVWFLTAWQRVFQGLVRGWAAEFAAGGLRPAHWATRQPGGWPQRRCPVAGKSATSEDSRTRLRIYLGICCACLKTRAARRRRCALGRGRGDGGIEAAVCGARRGARRGARARRQARCGARGGARSFVWRGGARGASSPPPPSCCHPRGRAALAGGLVSRAMVRGLPRGRSARAPRWLGTQVAPPLQSPRATASAARRAPGPAWRRCHTLRQAACSSAAREPPHRACRADPARAWASRPLACALLQRRARRGRRRCGALRRRAQPHTGCTSRPTRAIWS